MQLATKKLPLLLFLALGACAQEKPDSVLRISSPDGGKSAVIQEFQPRGTVDGYMALSLESQGNSADVMTIRHIENGKLAWISQNTLAIYADKIDFFGLSSQYYLNGTPASGVKVVVCSGSELDCAGLKAKIATSVGNRSIVKFPEG